jgi:hypothetical protein
MKHSNIYYIYVRNTETGNLEYNEVDGTAVKNSYGFDLFRHKHTNKSHEVVSEGMTGYKICDIKPGSTGGDYISSPKDINAFLGTYHQIDKFYRYEKLRKILEQMKDEGKLSPRYTEPEKRRSPKIKEINPDTAFSKCLYKKGKKYFVRIHNEDGIQLFKSKDSGNNPHSSVYAPCNGWMIPLDQETHIDEIVNKLKEGLNIHAWLTERFENQITDPEKWADVGIAEYLNRRDEADKHNAPIKTAMNEKRRQDDEDWENERKAQEQEEITKYETCVANAVNAIRNNETVNNDDIVTRNGNVTSIILELMKIYKIDVPLKTKGWINSALARIFYKDGDYTYSYYSKSKDSGIFHDCLNKLVNAVNEVF